MARTLSIKNAYDKKHVTFNFPDGVWRDALGTPEKSGAWLIYGPEKNGKTSLALILANFLSQFGRLLYISGEEGLDKAFVDSMKRAEIDTANKNFKILEYISIEELMLKLMKRKSAEIIVIDNFTIYNDELKNGIFKALLDANSNKLFIFLAHEERGEPYTATARLCRKLAKVIIHVKGLTAFVGGRVPGGTLAVSENYSKIFHSNEILNNS